MTNLLTLLKRKPAATPAEFQAFIDELGEDRVRQIATNIRECFSHVGLASMHAAAVEALCTTNKPASCTPDRLLEIKKFADYWSNPTTTKVEPQTAGALLQELLFHAQSLQGELNLYRAGDGKYNVDVQRGINFALDAVLKIGRRAISGGAIIISDGELDGIRNGENL